MNPLALEQNLVLSAGAGTGKTHSLMTLALHILGGARSAGPLPPEQLCIVTFTEKAAAQLTDRLRSRVEGLCGEGGPELLEPELRSSFEALGRPFPPPLFWRTVRAGLERAQVGTFHGLALRWLRPLIQRGEEETAQLLDEESAARILDESIERTVVAQLEEGRSQVAQLCRDLGFSSTGWSMGLVESLRTCFVKAREDGIAPGRLEIGSEEGARRALDEQLVTTRETLRRVGEEDTRGKCRDLIGTLEDLLSSDGLERLEVALRVVAQGARGKGLSQAKAALTCLAERHAAWVCAPLERTFRELLEEVGRRYRERLRALGAMDFAELLERLRDGWRDSPAARRQAQERVGALLVDEFQDTNRVQLELVVLLSEQREGAARPVEATPEGVLGLPLEPAFLAIVGDRKQSIYEFRGADVSLFQTLATRMEAAGGRRAFLQRNFRSAPALVDFFNQGFSQWMAPPLEARGYEVAFDAGDRVSAVRPSGSDALPVRVLAHAPANGAAASRVAEARALAVALKRLLTPPPAQGAPGAVRGGEVAVLFRRLANLEVYRQALLQAGVRHQVWRGRGFFAAPEIRDMEALLSWVCDPQDATSLAALLRSPFVALSDGALFEVAHHCGGRLNGAALAQLPALPAGVTLPEQERLQRFLLLTSRWRLAREQLDPRTLLEEALDQTGYRVAAAAGPHGDQILVNLERLLERAARAGGRGEDVAAFASGLRRLTAGPSKEPQAELQDGLDPDAVQLLTVHQSKGLEWPVVVLAELSAGRPPVPARLVMERTRGIALRAGGGSAPGIASARYREVVAEHGRREDAEGLRLFYVGLTRARDQLWLSGIPEPRGTPRGWAACVAGLRDPELAPWIESVDWEPPAPEPRTQDGPAAVPSEEELETLRAQVARVRAGRL